MFKLVIPFAGIGSRVSITGFEINKGFYPLGGRPCIDYILKNLNGFDSVVIILGHQKDLVRELLIELYPEIRFEFATVDVYEGNDASLARSLASAKHLLQCSFVFSPNDCFPSNVSWEINPNASGNWVASVSSSMIDPSIIDEYRGLEASDDGSLFQIVAKEMDAPEVYIGLCGVRDYNDFWSLYDSDRLPNNGEVTGIESLQDVKRFNVPEWFDIGNKVALSRANDHFDDTQLTFYRNKMRLFFFTKI